MTRIITYIVSALLAFMGCGVLVSCQDDRLDYPGGPIEPGISTMDVTLAFKDYTPALNETRAAGDAIKNIRTLWLVIYDNKSRLVKKEQVTDFKETIIPNPRPDDITAAESKTGHVDFKFTIDNGYYRIYAVANYDMEGIQDGDIDTPEKLKELKLEWDNDPSNLTDNAEMFGWFTNDSKTEEIKDDSTPVRIDGRVTQLHAWVRRAASKVTIAFDTQRLSNDVRIYLKSITIKDIPKECYLGASNIVGDQNYKLSSELYGNGETIYFGNATASQTGKADHDKWVRIHRGDSIYGLNTDKREKAPDGSSITARLAHEHSEMAPALYFYENMQGQGEVGTESDKRQDVTGNNKQVTYPEGIDSKDKAWKDAKKFGSYIEVQGYYENFGDSHPGRGDIIYRFMLGKDEVTDYDAERNYHYMLTMKFNGNANDVDFHIDYKEEAKPGILAQDTTYVSYLYNQETYTTVRATPREGYDLVNLKAYILDNEWRPHLEAGEAVSPSDMYNVNAWNYQVNHTASTSYRTAAGGYNRPNAQYNPTWQDGDKTYSDKESGNTEFGFLSLRLVNRQIYEFNGSGDKNAFVANMRKMYFLGDKNNTGTGMDKSKGYREYGDMPRVDVVDKTITDAESGDFKVTRRTNPLNKFVDYLIKVPLWTRAKSIDSWAVYSGANPFYRHRRYARILFIATYKNATGQQYQEADTTHVLQSRRIDNPRAIYRRRENREPFDVTLCYSSKTAEELIYGAVGDKEEVFVPYISRGAWSVSIEQDPNNLVKIVANGRQITRKGQIIYGASNTPVSFKYIPNAKPTEGDSYGAIILVRYNNLTCTHKIIVRQGYDPVTIGEGTARWSVYNIYRGPYTDAQGNSKPAELTVNPLSIGSTFRRHTNLDYPIAEENNFREGYGVLKTPSGTYKIIGQKNELTWGSIPASTSTVGNNFGTMRLYNFAHQKSYTYRLPQKTELPDIGIYTVKNTETLPTAEQKIIEKIGQAFGIAYADGAKKTLLTKDAYSFSDINNEITDDPRGVRGVAVYCVDDGDNIFFPFGSLGNPRRRQGGLLQYGSVSFTLQGGANDYRPMAYKLYTQVGGCYWVQENASPSYHVAIDYNGGNYMSSYLNQADVFQGGVSDALPIKPIRND